MQTFIIHYGELGLKGHNRPQFEKRLQHNIRTALEDLGKVKVRRRGSFLTAQVEGQAPRAQLIERLSRIFGIAYFAPAAVVPQAYEPIEEAVLEQARESIDPQTPFRIESRRSDKRFPIHSMEMNRRLGSAVVDLTGAPVDLSDPEVTVYVQIYPDGVYVFTRRIDGAGGLPVGTAGRVLVMLSGGIDSPVAAHMMLKRGCTLDFLHFHMLRSEEEIQNSKAVALARRVMEPHRLPATVYMAPAAPYQLAVMAHESRVELVVFRRFILRVAEALERRALAFVTGDNLGQVASQTLKNLHVTSRVIESPILRPLIAFDKQEIITLAQEIGTYELSIQPYQDPCSFRASRPATWAKMEEVEALEAQLDLEDLIEETLAQLQEVRIGWA
ncbi:MAG: tRNA uracil 4-sulfurtransferase ThiI [Anaerolineales bacterium]